MNIWNYTMIAVGLLLFFNFAGVPTGDMELSSYLGLNMSQDDGELKGADIQTGGFYDYFFSSTNGFFALILGSGVAIGLVYTGRSDIAILATVASLIGVYFVPVMAFPIKYAIENQFPAWAIATLAMIFVPLTIGYIFGLVKYASGGSN